jgi:two-component system LytT family response regulator
MTTLRTIVVDDEAPARDLLRSMLHAWPQCEIVGEAGDGESAVTMIQDLSPDLLFLDVQMPGLNGFDVVASLAPDTAPMIVFVTAFDQYALKAFEVSACDYLLKPFDEVRLSATVRRLLDRHAQADRDISAMMGRMRTLLAELQDRRRPIVVKVEGRHVFLDPDEIDWVEADDKELRLHVGKFVLRVRESMSSLERRLPAQRFLRVHRSTVVNRSRVREMQAWFQGEYILILKDGTRVVTGPSYRESVQALTRDQG